jgi:hypothetical protein
MNPQKQAKTQSAEAPPQQTTYIQNMASLTQRNCLQQTEQGATTETATAGNVAMAHQQHGKGQEKRNVETRRKRELTRQNHKRRQSK